VFLGNTIPHGTLEIIQRFHAERGGESFVHGDLVRRLDGRGLNVEFRRLAGELLVSVVSGEAEFERALFADGDADELRLETRNKRARADLNSDVLAFAALEGLAVDLADEGNRHAVAGFGLAAFRLGGIRTVGLGDALERLIDFGVGYIGRQPLELQRLEVAQLDRRHHFQRHLVG
jgi:hypothetical protein